MKTRSFYCSDTKKLRTERECAFCSPCLSIIKVLNRQHENNFFLCNLISVGVVSYFPAFLCRRVPPLGPMPNEDIDVANLESLEKYRSYTRYFKQAEESKNKPVLWKTYRKYVEEADPEHGEE